MSDGPEIPSVITIIKEAQECADELSDKIEEAKGARQVKKYGAEVKKISEMYKDHLKSIGKKETISVEKIVELNNKGKMPTMIKHCVVAVQKTIKGEGQENSFIGAHNICQWSFNRHKLTNKNGTVSSRGQLREKYHKSRSDENAGSKTQKYNSTFNKVFKKKK